MKAAEVLRRYQAGERGFRRVNLQGQSFKDEDLSGADFSEADIQGANFTKTTLTGATFSDAKAGLQYHSAVVLLVVSFFLSTVSGFVSALAATITGAWLVNKVLFSVLVLITLETFFTVTIRQGLLVAFRAATAVVAAGAAVAAAALIAKAKAVADAGNGIAYVAGTAAGAAAVTAAVSGAGAVAEAVAGAAAVPAAGAVAGAAAVPAAGAVAGAVVGAVAGARIASWVNAEAPAGATVMTVVVAAAVAVLSVYISRRALAGDEKHAFIRTIAIAFAARGTSFSGANLTDADFTRASLRSTDFRKATLNRTRFYEAQKLDYARVGSSILANKAVLKLLVHCNGREKSYSGADLRGANLVGADLTQANLKDTNISEATFEGASLESANLTLANLRGANLVDADLTQANLKDANISEATFEGASLESANLTLAQAVGTNFTRARMTGACIEAWNIESTTVLDDVDCRFIYLLEKPKPGTDDRERRPNSGDFAPGEFTKLFQEVLSTVDLIFHNGVNWRAFVTAFKQVQVENADTPLEIQSIENKGDGVVVVRVNVPPDTNKEKIHSEFNQQYELAIKTLEARYRAELQAKDSEIAFHREQSVNVWKAINLLARPIHLLVSAEARAMNNSPDQSQITVGGDFKIDAINSVVNLRDISGSVTNTINQLPAESDFTQPNLKELLSQLQQAIETDSDLPDADKADLLEQVQNLATAKQTNEPAQKEGLVRKAKKMFEVTLKSLPDTAKLVEACSKLLPLILNILGFPS